MSFLPLREIIKLFIPVVKPVLKGIKEVVEIESRISHNGDFGRKNVNGGVVSGNIYYYLEAIMAHVSIEIPDTSNYCSDFAFFLGRRIIVIRNDEVVVLSVRSEWLQFPKIISWLIPRKTNIWLREATEKKYFQPLSSVLENGVTVEKFFPV